MNSSMVVTEPLPASVWGEIGWHGAELVGDGANAYSYAQRTADGRIAIGGRGIPYRFGSRTDTDGVTQRWTIEPLTAVLHTQFPATYGVPLAHAWCGVLGVPRDWCASVTLDRRTGLGWAGGYVGSGLSTTYLAARTLADLVLDRDTDAVHLPWTNRRVRRWEPEPLRWLGVRTMYCSIERPTAAKPAACAGPAGIGARRHRSPAGSLRPPSLEQGDDAGRQGLLLDQLGACVANSPSKSFCPFPTTTGCTNSWSSSSRPFSSNHRTVIALPDMNRVPSTPSFIAWTDSTSPGDDTGVFQAGSCSDDEYDVLRDVVEVVGELAGLVRPVRRAPVVLLAAHQEALVDLEPAPTISPISSLKYDMCQVSAPRRRRPGR